MTSLLRKVLSAALAALLLVAPAVAQESKTMDASKSSDAAKPIVAVFRLSGSLTDIAWLD